MGVLAVCIIGETLYNHFIHCTGYNIVHLLAKLHMYLAHNLMGIVSLATRPRKGGPVQTAHVRNIRYIFRKIVLSTSCHLTL